MKNFIIGTIVTLLVCVAASESRYFPWINFAACGSIGLMAYVYHRRNRRQQ